MKLILSLCLILVNGILHAQERIPDTITTNLTLKAYGQPYTTTGFKVEKGATLTIMPGAKILFKSQKIFSGINDKKGKETTSANVVIEGKLIIGSQAGKGAKPTIIDSNGLTVNIGFVGSDIFINGLEAINTSFNFTRSTTGTIKNSSFISTFNSGKGYVGVEVPIGKGSMTIQNCLFENQIIKIGSSKFAEDLEHFTINKCAFTYNPTSTEYMDYPKLMALLTYGTQCDFYYDVDLTKMPFYNTPSLVRDWYFGNEKQSIANDEVLKLHENFILNKSSKPFTTFKLVQLKK